MSRSSPNSRQAGRLAAVVAAGLALAGCSSLTPGGGAAGGQALYAENLSSNRVMSDAVPVHHRTSADDGACRSDGPTLVENCGGFLRYDGP